MAPFKRQAPVVEVPAGFYEGHRLFAPAKTRADGQDGPDPSLLSVRLPESTWIEITGPTSRFVNARLRLLEQGRASNIEGTSPGLSKVCDPHPDHY